MSAPAPFEILHLDAHLVAVRKPAGWAVHRSDTVRDGPYVLPTLRDQLGQWVYPVHRLDRPTAGILLFALHPDAQRAVSQAFERRAVHKRYQAVVRGWWPADQAAITRPLQRADGAETQPAETGVTCTATSTCPWPVGRFPTARYSRLICTPHTGRWHQIRRHLAGAHHPIVGDVRHGDRHHNHAIQAALGIHRLALWADTLTLPHPLDGAPLTLRCPADPELQRLLAGLDLGCEPPPAGPH